MISFNFFLWKGLNKGFQTHLINITGKTKPSIKEIVEKFFIAYERYSADQKYPKSRAIKQGSSKDVTKSASFATKVNTKTPNSVSRCSLCSKLENQESNHPLFCCPRFDSPKLKIKKLNKLSGCIKCGNLNHQSPQCKFKFQRKCKTCSKWHFDFLC